MRRIAYLLLVALLAGTASAQAPAKKFTTFDDVLKQVAAGTPPADILNQCDAIFTLTDSQKASLTQAGAPKSLIQALEVKRIAIGAVTDFVVILDCSGSMRDEIAPGETKMDAAKRVVGELFKAIPNGRNLAFIVYGHDVALECKAVKVVRPLGPISDPVRQALVAALGLLKPTGHTPIAAALQLAGQVLGTTGAMSQIVVITDGLETCHGDPAAEAETLTTTVKGLRAVEVIGVGLKTREEKAGVANIARLGRGKFYDAVTAAEFKKALAVATAVTAVADVPPVKVQIPAVQAFGETTVDKPASLELGTTGNTTLGHDESLYAAVKLAANTNYLVTLDVRQKHGGIMDVGAELLDEDGVKVLGLVHNIGNDWQSRGAVTFTVKKAGKYIVRVVNSRSGAAAASTWLTVLPTPKKPEVLSLTAADLTKFDPKNPGLVPVPFCGTILPELFQPGTELTGQLDAGETKYYITILPKGEYKVLGGLTQADGRFNILEGFVSMMNGYGGGETGVVSVIENNVTARKSATLTIKETGPVIFRVQVGNPMKYVLRVRSAAE